jgi:hypothetical protein
VDHRAGLDDVEKRKFLTLPVLYSNSDPFLVQAVVSRCTVYSIPAHIGELVNE